MMRHRPGDTALRQTNRHVFWRNTRRSVKQRLRGAMPLYCRKGVSSENTSSQEPTDPRPQTRDRRAWK